VSDEQIALGTVEAGVPVNTEIWNRFAIPLWSDIATADEYYNRKPHLAHYTSVASMEKILQSNELWFANPLYMNDHEEMRFGISQGLGIVTRSEEIMKACGSPDRFALFLESFENSYRRFADEHATDTYVFCLSEHRTDDNDGLLSMWRGYGGNGSGIALVIDAAKIDRPDDSALILGRVHYGTAEARVRTLEGYARQVAGLLTTDPLHNDHLGIPATALFERIKLFALFTKHRGFEEEREWRIVYTPGRDSKQVLKGQLGYSIGAHGIEPRLRFKVAPTEGVTAGDLSLEKITDRIILGPTTSSPLALAAFHRLLEAANHASLKNRVRVSGIPYRTSV
jgi:hypothetical protein